MEGGEDLLGDKIQNWLGFLKLYIQCEGSNILPKEENKILLFNFTGNL